MYRIEKRLTVYFTDFKNGITDLSNNVSAILNQITLFNNHWQSNFLTKIDSIDSELYGIYNYLGKLVDSFEIYFWWNPDNWNLSEADNLVIEEYMSNAPKGWINFWNSFNNMSLKDFIIDVHNDIENSVNPLSDDNKAEFNNVMSSINNDTFIGSFNQIKDDYLPKILDSLKGQSATYTFKTASSSNKYFSIPAHTITLDMSWYLPYKHYGDMVLSGFMWLSFLWLLFKRFPSIINGDGMITDGLFIPDDSFTLDDVTLKLEGDTNGHY